MLLAQTGPMTSDDDLMARILNFLAAQHIPGVRSLEVVARCGVVTIRGRLRSFYQKQLCLHCCQRVAGVVRINDQLDVVHAAGG